MTGKSAMLADFATGTPRPDARAEGIIRASLFDWIACGIAGAEEPVSGAARRLVEGEGGTAEAQLFGGGKTPARAAALVNGAASHALDFDDTHFAHIGHLSVAVFPAAFAMAERIGSSGAAMLEAALVGFEGAARIGAWLGREHYDHGFHQTATAGAFGAAMAAGRLLGLTSDQMAHALGITATRASGLKNQFGTMGKPMNAGFAAANGVEAALLAQAGLVSRVDALDGAQGFGETHRGAGDKAAFDGLGDRWLTGQNSYKFHACCHGTHAMLEALGKLSLPSRDSIARVEITTSPRWARVCNIAVPQTGLEAKFSYRLCAALALLGRDTGRREVFSDNACHAPDVVALRDRVEVIFDDDMGEMQAAVRVNDAEARADLAEELPIETLMERLRVKARGLIGADRAARLSKAVAKEDMQALSAVMTA